MAFAGGGLNTPSARESAPGGRFFVCAVLSVLLMFFDQKDGWGNRIRYVLQALAYPIQVTVGSPGRLASATAEMFRTRASLREENAELQKHEQELELRTQRFEALEQENVQLRGLTGALPPLVSKSVLADVVMADLGRLRQRLVVNKGDSAGLFRSQSVVDAKGLVGQLVRVGPWSAEVMLISDPEAAVPVEILRTGERTIAVGSGDAGSLDLPYLPATSDVKVGDVIVTSGLGGVFPSGIPVGEITENTRDPDDLLAHVRARPRAELDRSRQLLALWFNPDSPAAPRRAAILDTLPDAPIADPVVRAGTATRAASPPAQAPAKKPPPPAGPHPPAPTVRPAQTSAPLNAAPDSAGAVTAAPAAPATPPPAQPGAAAGPAQ